MAKNYIPTKIMMCFSIIYEFIYMYFTDLYASCICITERRFSPVGKMVNLL